jgi:hypothetical protein
MTPPSRFRFGPFVVARRGYRFIAAVEALPTLDVDAPPGFPGWTIPIEPMFKPLYAQPEFGAILARLAERAR